MSILNVINLWVRCVYKMKLTEFQNRVYNVVKKIPRGKVLTYKQVAIFAGRPKAYRAVGNILAKNFNPQIPCHRVIRSDGRVGDYNRGLEKKIKLLKKEGFSSF